MYEDIFGKETGIYRDIAEQSPGGDVLKAVHQE
jgi:hypothetical protein